MKSLRKVSLLVILFAVTLFIFPVLESFASEVGVTIDGNKVEFTSNTGAPFIDSANRTQVPLRVTLEAYGCEVSWNDLNKIAVVKKNGVIVEVPIGVSYILVNGNQKINDTVAQIKNGRTYLPIRAVLEAFGATVNWDGQNSAVIVGSNKNVTNQGETPINSNTITSNIPILTQSIYASEIKIPVAKYQNKFYFLSEGYVANNPEQKFELDIYNYNSELYFPSNLNVYCRLHYLVSGNYSKLDYNFGNPNIDGTIYLDRNEREKEVITDYWDEFEGINQVRFMRQTINFDNGNTISVTNINNSPVSSWTPDNFIKEIPFKYSYGEEGYNPVIDLNVALKLSESRKINIYYSNELKCNVLDLD